MMKRKWASSVRDYSEAWYAALPLGFHEHLVEQGHASPKTWAPIEATVMPRSRFNHRPERGFPL